VVRFKTQAGAWREERMRDHRVFKVVKALAQDSGNFGAETAGDGYVHTKDQPNLQVSGSAPSGESGWFVQAQNFSETLSYQLVLYARCARLTP
jgi:hypothetical protein